MTTGDSQDIERGCLVFIKNSLNFGRIACFGECQHEEDASFLRVVHHGAYETFLAEFAYRGDQTGTDARVNYDGATGFFRSDQARHNTIGYVSVAQTSVDNAFRSELDHGINDFPVGAERGVVHINTRQILHAFDVKLALCRVALGYRVKEIRLVVLHETQIACVRAFERGHIGGIGFSDSKG